jgi:hypothetical protein
MFAVSCLAAFECLPGPAQGSASEQQSIRNAAIFASSGQTAAADVSSPQGICRSDGRPNYPKAKETSLFKDCQWRFFKSFEVGLR